MEDLNKEIRINALCGEGNLNANLMLIAQAPGENEDREGEMFIGEKYALCLPSKPEFHKIYGKVFWAGDRKILPLQHPAAMLYNPSVKEEMIKNYRKMRVLLIDCKWYPVCPMKKFYEKGKLSKAWVELYCKGDWESCIRYQMEERGEQHPDWMLPDGSIDERLHNFCKEMIR